MTAREEFLQKAWVAAEASSKVSGMPAAVTVAQAALESRWGESRLSREAQNYFGIKAHGAEARTVMQTEECAKGREVTIAAGFEKFATMEECFRRRDAILRHGAVYAEARACVADEERFVRAMARHWATDPEYAEKLLAVLREVKEARR
jgi:flagellum-specific peptidoglycan hydrolase FlgJ